MNFVLVIASYEPDNKLVTLIDTLKKNGINNILVVDDGSGEKFSPIFDSVKNLGCLVARYSENRGKGYALKYGFKEALLAFGETDGFVTADDDGQHKAGDILNIFNALEKHPTCIVLGVRNFKNADIPARSRIGNRFSSAVFSIETGVKCPDTQTGLRGIPKNAFGFALNADGDRYEYEMNFLYKAVKGKIELLFVPVETVYIKNNEKSHFRPIIDSVRIYKTPIKFGLSSLLSAASDVSLFALFKNLLFPIKYYISISNVTARILSGMLNYTLNKIWSFNSKGPTRIEAIKYFILFIFIMVSSTALVNILSVVPVSDVIIKIFVDIVLFGFSYFVQKIWVFKKK